MAASKVSLVRKILPQYVPENLNSIRGIKVIAKRSLGASLEPEVEIRFASQEPFPIMDTIPVLKMGGKQFHRSRYSDYSHLKKLTFVIKKSAYDKLAPNVEMTIVNGKVWKFGSLNKWLSNH